MFLKCEYAGRFLNTLEVFLKDKREIAKHLFFTEKLVLHVFGLEKGVKTDTGFDFIVLEAKLLFINVRPKTLYNTFPVSSDN